MKAACQWLRFMPDACRADAELVFVPSNGWEPIPLCGEHARSTGLWSGSSRPPLPGEMERFACQEVMES